MQRVLQGKVPKLVKNRLQQTLVPEKEIDREIAFKQLKDNNMLKNYKVTLAMVSKFYL